MTAGQRFKWKTQKACIWVVPVMIVCWLGGFLVAGVLPLPKPSDSPEEVAAMYEDDRTAIRIGLAIVIACAAWLAPFVGVLSAQLRRIEGRSSPLAYTQLAMGALLILEFVYPMMMLQTAAYRDDRSAEMIQTVNDMAWMLFVGIVSTVFIQFLVTGLAILQDDREDPVFPRWAGYFNLWIALLMAPGCLLPFFKDGPFAWNGVLTFWLVATAFTTWLAVMSFLLLRAVDHEQREEAEPADRTEIAQLNSELTEVRAELARVARLAEAATGAPSGST